MLGKTPNYFCGLGMFCVKQVTTCILEMGNCRCFVRAKNKQVPRDRKETTVPGANNRDPFYFPFFIVLEPDAA